MAHGSRKVTGELNLIQRIALAFLVAPLFAILALNVNVSFFTSAGMVENLAAEGIGAAVNLALFLAAAILLNAEFTRRLEQPRKTAANMLEEVADQLVDLDPRLPSNAKPGENAEFKRQVSSAHEGATHVNQLFRFAFKKNERLLIDTIITELHSVSRYYRDPSKKNWNPTPKNKLVAAADAMMKLLPELRGSKRFSLRRMGITTDFDSWAGRAQLADFTEALRNSLGDKLEDKIKSFGSEPGGNGNSIVDNR
jgi:hypothetical protein